MKTKYTFIASAVTLICSVSPAAFAWVQPGWDRPVYKADMSVLNEQGSLPTTLADAKSIELVMTQQDGSSNSGNSGTSGASGFVLLIDGQSNQSYEVKSISKDPCGSTVYTLVPMQPSGNLVLDHASQILQVTDHSDAVCMSFHRYRWELNVQNLDLAREVVGQMRIVGNPEAVITPQ